jgi:hypothetical protein
MIDASDMILKFSSRKETLACLATANPQAKHHTVSRFLLKQTTSTQASSSATAISALSEGMDAQKNGKKVLDASQGKHFYIFVILTIARRRNRNLMPIRDDGGHAGQPGIS